jgi:hypothetical protein
MDGTFYCGQLTGNVLVILLLKGNCKWPGYFMVDRQLEIGWGFYCGQLTQN